MFWKIIFLGISLYILYRFVFGFILPVYKTTQQIKKGFRDMQQKANEQANQQQASQDNSRKSTSADTNKQPLGEYIDYEEVK